MHEPQPPSSSPVLHRGLSVAHYLTIIIAATLRAVGLAVLTLNYEYEPISGEGTHARLVYTAQNGIRTLYYTLVDIYEPARRTISRPNRWSSVSLIGRFLF